MTSYQNVSNSTDECDTLTVNASLLPPKISKSFSPSSIPAGGTSDLEFTITNPNTDPTTGTLTGLSFTDPLPSNLTLASVPDTPQCNGTVSYNSGTDTITFTGGSLVANKTGTSSCPIDVSVTGTVGGSYDNTTSAITSTNGGTGNTASDTLTVVPPPAISKSFSLSSINVGSTSTLTFTLTNSSTTTDLTGVGFTDTFPTGMTIASSPSASNSCGGARNCNGGGWNRHVK